MEFYAEAAIQEISRQWGNGINPAFYNAYIWWV